MRKIFIGLSVVCLFFLASLPIFAKEIELRTRRVTVIPYGEKVVKDFYLNGGEEVDIAGEVVGDVIVAGGKVKLTGKIDGDLLAAGGTLDIQGEVTQNVRIAGGEINVNSKIGRNLTVAGGNIRITKPGEVKGSLVVFGGNVEIGAPIGGDVFIACGNADLSSEVNGNLEGYVDTFNISSGASIKGDVLYTSQNEAYIANDATISGKVLRKTPPVTNIPDTTSLKGMFREFAKVTIIFKIAGFISAFLLGLIMIKYSPNYLNKTSDYIFTKMMRSFGAGFVILIVIPVLFIFLLVTFVGISFGFIILLAYILFIYLSKIFIAYSIGLKISRGFTKNIYMMFFLGLLAYYIAISIPVVGGIFGFIALCVGLGASLSIMSSIVADAGKQKII